MIALVLAAWAQEVVYEEPEQPGMNAQLYRQALDPLTTMWTNDAGMRATYAWTARAAFGYARDPLVFQYEDGTTRRLVRDLTQVNLAGTVQLWRFRLGLDLPIFLFASSDALDVGQAGLGPVLVDLKGTILDHDRSGVGVALAARMELPTNTTALPLGRGVGYEVEAIVDGTVGGLLIAANIGHRGVPRWEVGDQAWDDQLLLRLGVGYMLGEQGGVSIDVASSTVYGDLFGRFTTPVEGMLGGWARLNRNLVLRLGLGTGFTDAIGSPLVRTVASVGWEPRRHVVVEAPPPPPPERPEPPPEPPALPPGPGHLVLRAIDLDGKPVDARATITHITVQQGVPRPEGPARLDVPSGVVEADLVAGRVAVLVEAEGYLPVDIEASIVADEITSFTVPMTKRARKEGTGRITITEQVFFDLDKASIKQESFELLREIAFILQQTPQIRTLRIEGHTDSRGSDAYNFRLSNDRAESVLEFLVAQGVERARLNAVGYGERRPLDPRESEESWALNRRVDFIIETWDDTAPDDAGAP